MIFSEMQGTFIFFHFFPLHSAASSIRVFPASHYFYQHAPTAPCFSTFFTLVPDRCQLLPICLLDVNFCAILTFVAFQCTHTTWCLSPLTLLFLHFVAMCLLGLSLESRSFKFEFLNSPHFRQLGFLPALICYSVSVYHVGALFFRHPSKPL